MIRTGAAAVVALCVGALALGGCADHLLLHPSREPLDAGRAVREVVECEGERLDVWRVLSPAAGADAPHAYVLALGGNAMRAEELAEPVAARWGAHPVEVWALNYPGYGASSGSARLQGIPDAALTAFDAVARAADGAPVFIDARSLGTTAALHVATQRPVAGLVLANPPPLQRLILRGHGWWNLWLWAGPVAAGVPDELDSMESGPHVASPAVFLISENDTVVPVAYQRDVVDAFGGPRRVVRFVNGGHNSALSGAAADELTRGIAWLWESAARPSPTVR